jgi:hypothetical protein
MLHFKRRFETLESDFCAEWLGVALIAIMDAVLSGFAGFHLIVTWRDGLQIAAGLGVMLALKLASVRRGGMMAEYFAVTAAATAALAILSYLCLAMSGPLVDDSLLAADRALRFDWLAGYHVLLAHPMPFALLKAAYNSMVYQSLYFCVLMSLMARKHRLREMFWLVFIAGFLACLGAAFFPALGPYKSLGVAPPHSFLPEMEHLKSGRNLVFAFSSLTGVVSFPSFHTAMALANIWGFRRTGIIGWAAATLNVMMLCATPWFGGHYLVDVFAGGATALLALCILRGAPLMWAKYFGAITPVAGLAI